MGCHYCGKEHQNLFEKLACRENFTKENAVDLALECLENQCHAELPHGRRCHCGYVSPNNQIGFRRN